MKKNIKKCDVKVEGTETKVDGGGCMGCLIAGVILLFIGGMAVGLMFRIFDLGMSLFRK